MNNNKINNYKVYKNRRDILLQKLHKKYSNLNKGVVILFAGFEDAKNIFKQESSFYYLTGINEPGVVLCLYSDGKSVLYVPRYGQKREQWVKTNLNPDPVNDEIKYLGQECRGYSIVPFFLKVEYEVLIKDLNNDFNDIDLVFSLLDESSINYFFSIYRFKNLFLHLNTSLEKIKDISSIVHEMRKQKDKYEVELTRKAGEITCNTHSIVAKSIKSNLYEYEIQAKIESEFIKQKGGSAFPAIIASGKNSVILHYTNRDEKLREGDLVVIDIGAEYGRYNADVSRTYPVSGKFDLRQRKVYEIVLATQAYIASLAKPGMFLNNPNEQEKSLHHLAVEFLREKGFDKYFIHGIGHFLGLDVHDVGIVSKPLRPGNLFTIEPGIYISEEGIGVRIEDDYLITVDGCECLTSGMVKSVEDIEKIMK